VLIIALLINFGLELGFNMLSMNLCILW